MRRLVRMLAVASLLLGVAAYARANPIPGAQTSDAAKPVAQNTGAAGADKLQKTGMEEEKGDLASAHGDYLRAASDYRDALRISGHDAMLWNKLGIAELKLNDWGEARKSFRRALKFDPRLIPALNNLGAVALLEKKYRPAAAYFKQALALDETVAATHVNLAEAWVGQHKLDRAMTEYARALELDPDVLSDSHSGDFALISTPAQRARISYLIAKAYMKRGNLEGALDYLERAKELGFPDLREVYTDPDFSALWKDPRLAKIVRR